MEIDPIAASDVAVGDLIHAADGWVVVSGVAPDADGRVELSGSRVRDRSWWHVELSTDDVVRRGDPAAVHHRDEFLGMTIAEARAWAGALGWGLRDRTSGGFVTDDLQSDRLNVWTDPAGLVERVELY